MADDFADAAHEFHMPVKGMAINDFSKLDIRDGRIHYKLYQQDRSFVEMDCEDTFGMRLFVSYVQKFDRYTEHGLGGTHYGEP